MITASCDSDERGWCVSGVRVNYVRVAFFVLASEFCDKGKISDPIKKFSDF